MVGQSLQRCLAQKMGDEEQGQEMDNLLVGPLGQLSAKEVRVGHLARRVLLVKDIV